MADGGNDIAGQLQSGFADAMTMGPQRRAVSKYVADKEDAIRQKTSDVETSVKNTFNKASDYLKRSATGLPSLGASSSKQTPPKTARRKGMRKPG